MPATLGDYHTHIDDQHTHADTALQQLRQASVQDLDHTYPLRMQGQALVGENGGVSEASPTHIGSQPRGTSFIGSVQPYPTAISGQDSRLEYQTPQQATRRECHVDFGVIADTETHIIWKSYDFVPGEVGVIGQPSVVITHIRQSRTDSARGFSSRAIVPLGEANGYNLEFGFNPCEAGRGVHRIVAHVTYLVDGRNISKTLKLRAIVGFPEDHEEVQIAEPCGLPVVPGHLCDDWQRGRMVQNIPQTSVVDFYSLPYYDVADEYWRAIQLRARRSDKAVKIHLQSLLPYRLETSTYKDHWTHLLWHEEVAIWNQLKQYDMNSVSIPPVPGANRHSLVIPGLQAMCPSIGVSDLIAIRKPGQTRPVYGGAVTEVRQSDVILQVHGDFPSIRGKLWDVRFTVNRLLLRRMHESVGRATSYFDRILFPEPRHQKARAPPATRLMIDRRISTNPEQKLAIEQIVSLAPGDIPFVIFGPPGTGKTTVVVEAIHQVLTTNPDSRLLVCAPSDSAADLLGVRLSKTYKYLPRKLLRLNALTRSYDALDLILRKHSLVDASGRTFKMPSKEELMSYRIVVTTCFSASTPRALRIEDHFTHIFIDEAGHASEPEIMIPILQNASRNTRIILSGDPKQLGPVVHSRPCEAFGMAESFLERLTKRPVYKVGPDKAGDLSVLKLFRNYRSHPAILYFPNQVFYGGEAQAYADPVLSRKLLGFGQLPRQGFPIIFHSVCGENQREGKSPSCFNIDEATLVKHYVKALLDGNYGLNANQVGVIAPYRQQRVKIRQLFQKIGFGVIGVKVTEDWQGQERRVIIVSTVRSDPELLYEGALKLSDSVASPRRMNVALTCAQSLLIVLGNGRVLLLDPFWNAFIRYVHASGGCRGDDLDLSEGGFGEGQFSGLKESNREYLEGISNEGLWDVLKEATSPWGASRS